MNVYGYNANLFLFNVLLYILMLYSFPKVYSNGRNISYSVKSTKNKDFFKYSFLLVIFTVFAFHEYDTYHYKDNFETLFETGKHCWEPIHEWIAFNLSFQNFYIWRLITWGGASILTMLTVKKLNLNIRIAVCFITLYYALTLSGTRGMLGFALMYYGISFLFQSKGYKTKYTLWGIFLIVCSYFFHKSVIVAILIFVVSLLFPLTKKKIIISLILYPLLVKIINTVLSDSSFLQLLAFNDDKLHTASVGAVYLEAETEHKNLTGLIVEYGLTLPSSLLPIYYITKKIYYEKYKLPKNIIIYHTFWYYMYYFSFLFYFLDMSRWLYIRFSILSIFPMVVVLTYYYTQNKTNRFMKLILITGLLSTTSTLFLTFLNFLKYS